MKLYKAGPGQLIGAVSLPVERWSWDLGSECARTQTVSKISGGFHSLCGKGDPQAPCWEIYTISSVVWERETSDREAGRKIAHACRHECVHTASIHL